MVRKTDRELFRSLLLPEKLNLQKKLKIKYSRMLRLLLPKYLQAQTLKKKRRKRTMW